MKQRDFSPSCKSQVRDTREFLWRNGCPLKELLGLAHQVGIYIYIQILMCIYIYMYTCVCVYVWYILLNALMYIYIYISVYIYICIYLYIYIPYLENQLPVHLRDKNRMSPAVEQSPAVFRLSPLSCAMSLWHQQPWHFAQAALLVSV